MTQPAKNPTDLEEVVLSRVLRLNAVVQGIVTGIMVGLGVFLATIWLVIKGGRDVGAHLGLLSQYFWGYDVTVGGSFVGLAYGGVTGFVVGYAVARLYNWIVDLRHAER